MFGRLGAQRYLKLLNVGFTVQVRVGWFKRCNKIMELQVKTGLEECLLRIIKILVDQHIYLDSGLKCKLVPAS